MTHLYLIRHGQSVANVDPHAPTAGMLGDRGLTAHGRLQAERLRDRLAATGEIEADTLIASTLLRARQTAEIIAPALGLPILLEEDAQELRVGEIDGVPWDEVAGTVTNFRREPLKPFAPGGESLGQFALRVATTLERITREHAGETIVLVSHGGFIELAFTYFFGLSSLALPQVGFHTRNTAITHWELRAAVGHPDEAPRWRLMGYNDDLHTRDITTGERLQWVRLARQPVGTDRVEGQEAAPTPDVERPPTEVE